MAFLTHEEAEAAFYAAFQNNDIDSMMSVWADNPDIACIHPQGSRVIGSSAIRRSWELIFAHQANVRIEVVARRTLKSDDMAAHLVNEHFYLNGKAVGRPVLATNIYQRDHRGWHIVLHHASSANIPPSSQPELMLH